MTWRRKHQRHRAANRISENGGMHRGISDQKRAWHGSSWRMARSIWHEKISNKSAQAISIIIIINIEAAKSSA